MKHFYSELIDINSVIIELNSMDLTEPERTHLANLIDSSIHKIVLDTVMSHLNSEEKYNFLEHLEQKHHDQIWKLLESKEANIKQKIIETVKKVKEELHKDIAEAKQKIH